MSQDLYAPPSADLEDPSGPPLVLADRSTRLAASIVDGLVLIPALLPLLLVDSVGLSSSAGEGTAVVLFVIALGWNLVLMARDGQSIAKRMFCIRVVRSDGSRISLARYFFLRALPAQVFAQIPLLGFLDPLAIFRESRKCIHDELADSVVVKAR